MLDSRYFQENLPELEKALQRRNASPELSSQLAGLSKRRKELILGTETLKAQRNAVTQEIAQLKAKAKTDPEAAKVADEKVLAMRAAGDKVKAMDEELKAAEEQLQ